MERLARIVNYLKNLLTKLRDFFGEVPGSIKNHLNTEEIYRITVAALSSGAGFFGLFQAIMLHIGTIFPAPADAAMASLILTVILETYRRLGQGSQPMLQRLPYRRSR